MPSSGGFNSFNASDTARSMAYVRWTQPSVCGLVHHLGSSTIHSVTASHRAELVVRIRFIRRQATDPHRGSRPSSAVFLEHRKVARPRRVATLLRKFAPEATSNKPLLGRYVREFPSAANGKNAHGWRVHLHRTEQDIGQRHQGRPDGDAAIARSASPPARPRCRWPSDPSELTSNQIITDLPEWV